MTSSPPSVESAVAKPRLIRLKLFMKYYGTLDESRELLGAIKQLTNPKIFNAEVNYVEPFYDAEDSQPKQERER